MAREIELQLLGPTALLIDGVRQQLGGPRQRAVLAYLAIRPNQTVPADSIIDDLWADEPLRQPRNNLQVYVSSLRRVLKSTGDRLSITGEAGGYRLVAADGVIDHVRFQQLVQAGQQQLDRGAADAAARTLRAATDLWRGSFLEDLAGLFEYFVRIAAAADEQRLRAQELTLTAEIDCGRAAEQVAELTTLTAANPMRERLWVLLMTALYRSSRQTEALRTYERARRALAEQAGVEPGPEMRAVQDAILAGRLPMAATDDGRQHVAYLDEHGVERRFSLRRGDTLVIGRHPDIDISIDWDLRASRRHAEMSERDGTWWLRDLGSTNGTWFNSQRLEGPHRLAVGDTFVVGNTRFAIIGDNPSPPGMRRVTTPSEVTELVGHAHRGLL